MQDVLDRFFNARTIAVIGASTDPTKLGGRPIRQNVQLGFTGRLIPVNASADEVQGLPAVREIDALPDDVDFALLAVPAAHVESAIEKLALRRISLAIILSSGFAEHSPDGAATQRRIVDRARASGMRIVGPNSMGGLSFENRMSATFTSINEHEGRSFPLLGDVSIASQSGFIGSHLMAVLRDRGLGVAKWLATGNQADIDLADVVAHYARDNITRVIVVYLEGGGRGDALRAAFDLARARGKPVVALKAGRTSLGGLAAASHTAALVGDAAVCDAVFHRHGVASVASLDELADVVAALATHREIPGPDLGVATVSGGFGILISDAASNEGFALPELRAELQASVRAVNNLATTRNPVDMGSLLRFEHALEALQKQGCDALVIAAGHFGLMTKQAEQLQILAREALSREPERFIALIASLSEPWRRAFQQMGVFVCEDPGRAIRAMAKMRTIRSPAPQPERLINVSDADPAEALRRRDEYSARALLRAIGIPVVEEVLVTNAKQAAAVAGRFGDLLVLKIVSADLPHKSDIGGVLLRVPASECQTAFTTLMSRVAKRAPTARIDGVLMSPMIEGGVETIAGVKHDPMFGPVVMFGLGGVFVEALKDTAVEPAPFGLTTAHALIRRIGGYPLLSGARGRPAADLDALAETLARLSSFAAKHASKMTIEINPLLATPNGALALDALVQPDDENTMQ